MKLKALCLSTTVAFSVASNAMAADIVIGIPSWPSVNAVGNILKVVIEDNLGLDVEIQNGTNPIIFEAMDTGSMHIHPEVWIPNQQNLHDTYVEDKKSVMRGGGDGVEAFTAMCVPTKFAEEHGITSIDDLTDPSVAALFDNDGDGKGEIWIGAPGWASTNIERIRAKSYGYEETLQLQELDDTLAYANLDAAVEAGKGWVGVCYTPHYMWTLYDVTPLEEPPHDPARWTITQPTDDPNWLEASSADVHWPSAYLYPYFSASLEESHPAVASLLKGVDLDPDTVSAMTYEIAIKGADPAEFAKAWVAKNEDRVLDWLAN